MSLPKNAGDQKKTKKEDDDEDSQDITDEKVEASTKIVGELPKTQTLQRNSFN